MSPKQSRADVVSYLDRFFATIEAKTPREIKRAKRLAMKHQIAIQRYRRLFCQTCFHALSKEKTRVTKERKIVQCPGCQRIYRFSFNSS